MFSAIELFLLITFLACIPKGSETKREYTTPAPTGTSPGLLRIYWTDKEGAEEFILGSLACPLGTRALDASHTITTSLDIVKSCLISQDSRYRLMASFGVSPPEAGPCGDAWCCRCPGSAGTRHSTPGGLEALSPTRRIRQRRTLRQCESSAQSPRCHWPARGGL